MSQKRRLSGWARLWIVILVPAMCVTIWILVDAENSRWRYSCDWIGCPGYVEREITLRYVPPEEPQRGRRWDERGNPLPGYYNDAGVWVEGEPPGRRVTFQGRVHSFPSDATDEEIILALEREYRGLAGVDLDEPAARQNLAREVEQERERRATHRAFHGEQMRNAIVYPLISFAAAFVLLMIAKWAVVWVWRGFRPPEA